MCSFVPVLPEIILIKILCTEKHDRILWRSRQDGRNSWNPDKCHDHDNKGMQVSHLPLHTPTIRVPSFPMWL